MKRLALLFCLLVLIVPGQAEVPEHQFDQMLLEASEARSSDRELFDQLLSELRENESRLSAPQQHFLSYLTGYYHAYKAEFDGAVTEYKRVLNDSDDPNLIYRAGFSLVNVYSITRDWSEGLMQLRDTLELETVVTDDGTRHEGWIVAGVFYNQLGQHELALDFANKLFSDELTPRNLCFAHHIRIEALLALGRLDPSSTEIPEAIASCERIDEPVVSNFIRANLAQLMVEARQFEAAHDTLMAHLREVEQTQYKRLIAESYGLLSQAALGMGNGDQAKVYAERALDSAQGFLLSKPTLQAYWTLKEHYRQEQDYVQALEYERRHIEAEKGLIDDQSNKQLAFQLAQHQVVEKNQQIELLSQQNNVLQLRETLAKETAEKNRLFLYLMVLLASSLAFWGYFLKRNQSRLKYLAEYDGLTGLNNRRHFGKSAEELLRRCQAQSSSVSLVMLDLDQFKTINDRFGHAVGDWVLKKSAETVAEHVRESDTVGRIGGEEFAVLLPACVMEQAQQIAEVCRKALVEIDCSLTGHEFCVSASFGVSSTEVSGYDLEDLMKDSDSALYCAKEQGRNRVVCFQPGMRC